jgi:hypothetical protein
MKRMFLGSLQARLLSALLLAGASLLVMGAAEVTRVVQERPWRCYAATRSLSEWSRTLLVGVPGGEGEEWDRLADECPQLIVQACTRLTVP